MTSYAFRILNVFTRENDPLSGNPLCVFEDARGLTDMQMQALARQMNLSETTFILPARTLDATAHVRIFTPSFEMPFAGHPTLGSAHVVRDLSLKGDHVVLDLRAGNVHVDAVLNHWTLRAVQAPIVRTPEASQEIIASMLGLPSDVFSSPPLWVDTGAEQLVIPLRDPEMVLDARPVAALLAVHGFSAKRGASMAYVWAPTGPDEVLARFFFIANGAVLEDPATGSACANLGGWLVATKSALPRQWRVLQGASAGRPSELLLRVDAAEQIFVGGHVHELGRGTLSL